MYIRNIYIGSFGKLKELEFEFSKGLNVIEGSNEAGKSTLCMFIKFMLYGLSGRSVDGEMSERQKYVSWDIASAFGEMVIATAKGDYKIKRELLVFDGSQPKERLSVTDIHTGEAVFKGKVPGVCILGMDEQMFVNTVFVRQVGGVSVDGSGMTQAIENILISGDESVSLKKALDRLDKSRKALMHKRGSGGALQTAMQERARLEREISESRQGNADMIELESESERIGALIEERTKEKEYNERLLDAYLKIEKSRRVDAALEEAKTLRNLNDELKSLDEYGNVSEKIGKINALSAKLSGIDSRLRSLKELLGEEPDGADSMTEEEMLLSKKEAELGRKLNSVKNGKLVAFILCLIFGAALLGAGVFLMSSLSFGKLLLPAGGVLLCIAIIFAVLFAVDGGKLKSLCKKWGASRAAELDSAIEDRLTKARAYNKAGDEYNRRVFEIGECEDERKKVLSSLRAMAGELLEEDAADTDILVSAALEKASEILQRREELRGDMGASKARLTSFSDVLAENEAQRAKKEANDVLSTKEGALAESFTKAQADSCKNKKSFAESVLPGLLKRKGEVDSLLARRKATTKDTAILTAQLDGVISDIDAMKKRLSGIEGAVKALNDAGVGLRSSFVPKVVSEAERLMGGFTDGKYCRLCVEDDFSVSFIIDGVKREMSYMSSGTSDAAYVSLRRALSKVLFGADSFPLIYDESFARVDEKRLSEIMKMLCDDSVMQSFVFTCRALEGEISHRVGGNTVKLG